MKVRTSVVINSTREALWPLLTNSTMDVPGCFCLRLPRPIACELPSGIGGVGAERRCISDRGTVIQRITTWDPPSRLQFRMISTDHSWSSQVESLEEDFRIEERAGAARITRTTQIKATTPFRLIKERGFYLGLKRVHHYVFMNWRAKGRERSSTPAADAC